MMYFHYEELKQFMTVKDVAKILNVGIHTVYRLIASGELPAMKISPRKTLIKYDDFEKYINEK